MNNNLTAIDGTATKTATFKEVEFTRVNSDVNGDPRYAFHFTALINEGDRIKADHRNGDTFGISTQYEIALIKAKKIGGRKFHNKQYGGGIVVSSYNTREGNKAINELREVNTDFKKE